MAHSVKEYLNICGGRFVGAESVLSAQVKELTFDSRESKEGTLFVCKGETFKESYLKSAFEKGAICYVAEEEYDGYPGIIVPEIRRAMALLANLFSDYAFRDFPLIGMTGTKGKSTTLYYIKNILEKYCAKNGLNRFGYLSTIDTFDGVEEFESHLTTPESIELAKRFIHARDSKLFAMGMEVSSQALKYDRTYGVEFSLGLFTNFGIDHIGDTEHPTVEDYLESKLRFFDQCKDVILNLDSDKLESILPAAKGGKLVQSITTYSPSGKHPVMGLYPDYIAVNPRKEEGNILFEIEARRGEAYEELCTIKLCMPGFFNVENALAATVVCLKLGVPTADIQAGLADATAKGRMELFENKEKQIAVISDYAHNELSFEEVFKSVKQEFPGWRIEALFGCPGGKGFIRRTDLPRVTAKYADFVWITEEDPAFDDPMEISKTIQENLAKGGCPSEIVIDREEAVTKAIKNAAPKTVVVLLAKGREEYMHRGSEYVPIKSDSQLAEELINCL